jgi:single-strand DNA-binding protein
VVLQKFRGELTMLGGRADGGGGDRDFGDGGYSSGGASGGGGGGFQRGGGSGPKESFPADLDDEIPF